MQMKKMISSVLILSMIISIINMLVVPNRVSAVTMSSNYTQYVKSGISAFPKSYQSDLKKLAELHPNWKFQAYNTGIDWNELVSSSAENKCKKNTIYYKSGSTIIDPEGLCICGKSGDVNYYCASASTVNYYLDPRNFLDETMIFQFLNLSYDENITKDILKKAVANSFLNGKFKIGNKEYTYVDTILEASKESKVSAMHIVVTIFQELGRGSLKSDGTYSIPTAASGTVDGYEGLYNFFNYGATDGAGAVQRGLKKAKEMGWTNPDIAIKDGVKRVLANNYINVGQNTKYFYKFDVVGNEILTEAMGKKKYSSSYFFSHQYMTNIQDPSSQAINLFTYYTNGGILSNSLTFVIPVYDNMPDAVSNKGTTLKQSDGTLYKVDVNSSVNIRSKASTSSSSLGTASRGMIVAVIGSSGSFYKVKLNKATTYNSSNKKWNMSSITGYISKNYLEKADINTGSNNPTNPTTPNNPPNSSTNITSTANLKFDNKKFTLKVVPDTKIKTITDKYSKAIITDKNGKKITGTSTSLATGYIVNIDNKKYTIITIADVNGDNKITSSDLLKVVNHLNGNKKLSGAYLEASDVNQDGKVMSSDLLAIVKHLIGTSKIKLK